ncbi:MAG: tyrosine-type recombinase/integrase [Nocardioides sp.]|uniref:site-specific integrase n=1 Tax=Nocardioides sp. TaxID=35761 RepID=UPI0039E365F5
MRASKPRASEPIRLVQTKAGPRYRVVLDVSPKGAPRKQVTKTLDLLGEARQFVNETRDRLAKGSFTAPSKVTLRQLADAWLAEREAESQTPGGIREVSVNGYRSALHAPLMHMGEREVQTITPADVRALLRTLATEGGKWRRGLSHRSLVYALGAIRQVFAYGVENGVMATNPGATVKPPRQQHTKAANTRAPLRWSPEQLVQFRAFVDTYGDSERFAAEPWLRAGMRLTLTGMRRSEVLGLDWSCVEVTAGAVEVVQGRVKTGRGTATALGEVKAANSLRTVHADVIHAGTAAALRLLWLAQGRPESGLVICDAAGEPVDPDAYSARFRGLCKAAGLPALTSIHNVRHTLATALKAAGVPDHEAAALLGHDVDTYRRFYLVPDDAGAAAAALAAGKLFSAAR